MKNQHSQSSIMPPIDGETYTKFLAKIYDWGTQVTGWREKLARHALEGFSAPGKLLDVGCGTGYLLSMAQEKGFDVIGVDPSEGMLEKAVEKYGLKPESIVTGLADKLPFPDNSFDMVMASGSLEYVKEIEGASAEMIRVAKKGGIIRIIDHAKPQEINWKTKLVGIFCQLSGDILHNYPHYFSNGAQLVAHKTLGRGGYMQLFDFKKL